jgi:superfamily II DNA/RNA helicase
MISMKKQLEKAFHECGYTDLNEIQKKAIPEIEAGKSLFLHAHTGSGKTLAYLIPALEKTDVQNPETQVLILSPTRELALQIKENAEKISVYTGIHIVTLIGGLDIRNQENALRHRPQILIATAGRLRDLQAQGKISLDSLKIVILDEADQIISTGQKEDVMVILKNVSGVQTILVSATTDPSLQDFLPETHETVEGSLQEKADITSYVLPAEDKKKTLLELMKYLPITSCIVFTNYRNDANELSDLLKEHNILCAPFSAFYDEKTRIRTLKKFREGRIRVLAATDAAARGLDINDVSHVIHYDVPQDLSTYTHRSGRSAHQAGSTGTTITLLTAKDLQEETGKVLHETCPEFTIDKTCVHDLSKPLEKKKEEKPSVMTLWINAGRNDKLRPKDIIGALCTVFDFKEIGVLEIQNTHSTVTILKEDPDLLKKVKDLPIKGKKRKYKLL